MRRRRFRPKGDRNEGRGGNGDRNRGDRSGNDRGGRGGKWEGRGRGERGNRGGRGRFRREGPKPEGAEVQDFWSRLLGPSHSGEGRREESDFLEKTPCPACGTLPARIKGRLGPTLLRKCRSCSLVYISPRLSTAVREDMLRREPSPLSSERNLMLRHQMAARMERMHREMPALKGLGAKSASLLEVGCRWGHFLQLCRPHYRSVEGLEWSKERAAFARERFDLEVSATDIFRDPWPNHYDLIVAWELIEREPHPLEFLRWIGGHLNKDGLLVLSTPNYNSISRRILRSRWRHFEPSRHLCYFTPSTLKALLRQAGFGEVKIKTYGLSRWRSLFSRHNQVDRTRDARGQWLGSLRGREAYEAARRGSMGFKESAWAKVRKHVREFLSGLVTSPGWGDQMRVYARKG